MDPLAALGSLFGGKPKPKAAVLLKVKVTTKPTVKAVAKTQMALPTPAFKDTTSKKEPIFSFFNKPVAPKMASTGTHTLETKLLPAATQMIDKEVKIMTQQANTSLFTGFFVSKPKLIKGQAMKLPPPAITRVVPAKAAATRAFARKKKKRPPSRSISRRP